MSTLRQSAQKLPELELKLRKLGRDSSRLRKYDYVSWVRTAVAVGNSQTAFEAIAQHGVAEGPPDGHDQAAVAPRADPKVPSLDPAPAFPVHSRISQPRAHTARRLRPLRRRRAIIARPLGVRMRLRNPCLFRRLRLLG